MTLLYYEIQILQKLFSTSITDLGYAIKRFSITINYIKIINLFIRYNTNLHVIFLHQYTKSPQTPQWVLDGIIDKLQTLFINILHSPKKNISIRIHQTDIKAKIYSQFL